MSSYNLKQNWTSSTLGSGNTRQGVNNNVVKFQKSMKEILSKEDQDEVTHVLGCYHKNRNIYYLAQSLKSILDTPNKKTIIPLLRQVIPKSDRPGFDQFTCEETFVSRRSLSRHSTLSHIQTEDSGIGHDTNSAVQRVDLMTNDDGILTSNESLTRPSRASSMSDLTSHGTRSSEEKPRKRFPSGSFGSAVRRRVKAVLARRGSFSSPKTKSSDRRRHNSESQLNFLGRDESLDRKYNSVNETHTRQRGIVQINLQPGKHRRNGLGFLIGGGSEYNAEIFVSRVDPGSASDFAGLCEGDVIVRINDIPIQSGVSQETAAAILQSSDKLTLFVRPCPPNTPNRQPKSQRSAKNFLWTDTHGRQVSPPDGAIPSEDYSKTVLDNNRSNFHPLSKGERKVNLTVKPGQHLGLMIRGGSEYGLGIFVSGVDELSAAENAGLKIGDQILEINNIRLENLSHAEAVSIIRSSHLLMMTVRHDGKIPQGQGHLTHKLLDDRVSLHSKKKSQHSQSNGVKNAFQRRMMNSQREILPSMVSPRSQGSAKLSSTMSGLEEALLATSMWMTLNDGERRSVRYYVKEYAGGHVTPDALVLALSQILDDHEKFSLMSAVRHCILESDLDRFDVLVLRREVESLRNRHQTGSNDSTASLPSGTANSTAKIKSENASISTTSSETETVTKFHSTPNESYTGPPSDNKLTLSPVSVPPPTRTKTPTPPAKPKRSSVRIRRPEAKKQSAALPEPPKLNTNIETHNHRGFDSSNETAVGIQRYNDHEISNSFQFIDTSRESSFERPSSPFSKAIEKHSGRIKLGSKLSHPSLVSGDIFVDPKSTKIEPQKINIEPVKFSNFAPKRSEESQLFNSSSSEVLDDFPPPPLTLSPSTSTSSFSESALPLPPPGKISLRMTSFGSSLNEKVCTGNKMSQYSVKADIHRQPSTKEMKFVTTEKLKLGKSSNYLKEKFNLDEPSSTSVLEDVEPDNHMCLNKDVETQKVVIFKMASSLGLTIEGGAGTKQPLPKIIHVKSGSCAQMCGRVKIGHVIHKVNGRSLHGLKHEDAVREIAFAFKHSGRDSTELLLSGPYS